MQKYLESVHILWHHNAMSSRATITLESNLLDDLMTSIPHRVGTKAKAVRLAIEEYIHRRKLQKIKRWRGKVEFVMEAREIRKLNDRSARLHH